MQSLSNDASASRPSAGTGCKASTDLRVYRVLILKGCDLGKGSTAPRLRVVMKPSGGDAVSLAASPACYMMSFGPARACGFVLVICNIFMVELLLKLCNNQQKAKDEYGTFRGLSTSQSID